MATLGLIGGLGPETTVEYYRLIIERYREKSNGVYPSVIINSVDLKLLLDWMAVDELDKVTDYLAAEIDRLHQAGVDIAALASNTPHIVFAELQRRSRVPLVSIVEAACTEAESRGLKTVALIGTRYTMKAEFYPRVFTGAGIRLVTPSEEEQVYIHDKYIDELLNNLFLSETRDQILGIVDALKVREGIEAVVLGGTELPLLLRAQERNGVFLLDTARIHVDALVDRMLS